MKLIGLILILSSLFLSQSCNQGCKGMINNVKKNAFNKKCDIPDDTGISFNPPDGQGGDSGGGDSGGGDSGGGDSGVVTGELDTSFNDPYGYINRADSSIKNEGVAIGLQSNGKVIVLARQDSSSRGSAVIAWRFNTDGTLDNSFGGGDGIFVFDLTTDADTGLDMVVGSDDSIYISGTIYLGGWTDLLVIKLTPAGELDLSFGGGNGYVTNNQGINEGGRGIALDSSGNIIVAGRAASDVVIWSFSPSGILNYVRSYDINGGELTNGLAIDSDDSIIVTGYFYNGTQNGTQDVFVLKLLSNGTLDNSFDSDGILTIHNIAGGDKGDYVEDIIVLSNGNYAITGYSHKDSSNLIGYVLVLNPNGTLESSFSSDGIFTYDNVERFTYGTSIAEDSNGKIIIAGSGARSDQFGAMTIRITPSGEMDSSFGINGMFLVSGLAGPDTTYDVWKDIALNSSGAIFVTGYSNHPDVRNAIVGKIK